MPSYQPRPSVSLGKTIMSLTLQVVVALALSSSMGQGDHHLLSIPIVIICMIIAFAASFSGIFQRGSYPKTANTIENLGSLVAAVGFFIAFSFLRISLGLLG